jgi:pSer/pThr/pTyr-binding forkhead associated (FHA) protein
LQLGLRGRQPPLPGLDADQAAAVAALPPGSAFLICHQGAGAGSRYLLDKDRIAVGRDRENDICLEDITVSRRHLELLREDHRYLVHDLASLNGTYLNHDRVDLAALTDSDELRVGAFRLVYYGSPRSRESRPPAT